MKYYIWFLPITLCLAGAIYLMSKGSSGWGWLLFLAICLIPEIKENKTK